MISQQAATPRTTVAAYMPLACAALLLAFAARTLGLGRESLWYDEAYTALFARNDVASIISGAARLELNLPLHYLALKAWARLAGESEFALRALSVFAGLATTALVAPLAGRGRWRRLGALTLMAVWPVAVNLSQELRMYPLAIALGTASAVLFFRALRVDTRAAWIAWSLVSLAAFATHVLAAFVIAAQLPLWLLWRRSRRGATVSATAAPVITCCVIAAAGALIYAGRDAYGTTFTGALNLVDTMMKSLAALTLPRLLPERALAPAAALALAACASGLASGRSRGRTLIAVLTLAAIAVFCVATGKFAARYVVFAQPLLLAALFGARVPRRFGQLLFGMGVAGALAATLFMRSSPLYANDDFRGAAQLLRNQTGPDEAALLVSGHASPALDYYWPGAKGARWHALPDDPVLNVRNAVDYDLAAPALNRALAGKRGAWLLLWQDDVIDPANTTQTLLRRQSRQLMPDRESVDFHGLRLMHFTFSQPYAPLPEAQPRMTSAITPHGPDIGLHGLGCHQFVIPPSTAEQLEIACFWKLEPGARVPFDAKISLRLLAATGDKLAQTDQRLADFGLPYVAYDKSIVTIYRLRIPAGSAPGRYALEAYPYIESGEITPRIVTQIELAP